MQQDLLFAPDEPPVQEVTPALPVTRPPLQPRTVAVSAPSVEFIPEHKAINCTTCGGTGACVARSTRSKTVPCVCCSGFGKYMRDTLGRRLPMRAMIPLLQQMGIEIPEHAYFRG